VGRAGAVVLSRRGAGDRRTIEVKWYFGGIAGDEPQALERLRRGQIEGVARQHHLLELAPSLRVGSIVGLFHSRREWAYVLTRLRKSYDEEFAHEGMVDLGVRASASICC